ncbi:hypothetical protein ACHAWC_005123 [Mediolabrus comicus]
MVKLLRKYLNNAKRQGSKQRRIDSNMNRCEISYTRIEKRHIKCLPDVHSCNSCTCQVCSEPTCKINFIRVVAGTD